MTLYLPTDEEAAEGIGAWDDTQETAVRPGYGQRADVRVRGEPA